MPATFFDAGNWRSPRVHAGATNARPQSCPEFLDLRQRRCAVSCSLCVCVSACVMGVVGGATSSRLASTVLWGPGPGWPVAASACGVCRASRMDGDRCPWDRDRGLAFCGSCGSFADLTCGLFRKVLGCYCNCNCN